MTRFVIAPQWQGSPSSRAMQLTDGAEAIAGDLPRAACTQVAVPLEAGESLGTAIRRLSALSRTRDAVRETLSSIDEGMLLIGGDCGVAVPAIGWAHERHPQVAVVWFDSHPDLHSPESSPSGAFAGMALRAVLGEAGDELSLPAGAIDESRVVLAGARSYDPAEEDRAGRIATISPDDLADPRALVDAVLATGADAVFIHVDLDVLDPSAISGVTDAVPFGVAAATLVSAISAVRERLPLVGSSLTGFAPASRDAAVEDLGTILRLIGALA